MRSYMLIVPPDPDFIVQQQFYPNFWNPCPTEQMEYFQNRQTQQYPVSSSSTTVQSQAAPSNYMYGSNSMYYSQPSTGLQQYPPQHFSAGMAPAQNHAQPTAPHTSHWNNDYSTVAQQNVNANQQSRRPPQHQQTSATYGTYRPTQVQTDSSNPAANLGIGRPGHAPLMAAQGPPQHPQQDLPLRMVVEAKFVGAIIGQGGGNIREISKESKARCVVDVTRAMRDQDGTIEKVISILGQPENCSKACVKILEVIQRELEKEDQDKATPEVTLKLRAHNQLVGRLIGKQGSTIKKIMQDTNSTIFVSNSEPASQMSAAFPPMLDILQQERTITVRAPTIQDVSNAEQKISAKLRQSFEMDIANRMQQFPGGYPVNMPGVPSMINPIGDAYAMVGMNVRNPLMANTSKTVRMFVPNNMVGAIIGTKGANIRNIMRNSGAQIKIEGGERKPREGDAEEQEREKEREREEREKSSEEERMVTIIGNDGQQYRAQFWIYQRVAEQTNHNLDEVRLRTEVLVPTKLVGRIIGKGGQNVRELQRVTGAQVKIPEDSEEASGSADGSAPKKDVSTISDEDMSSLRIIGTFQSAQSVQLRIAHVCADFARLTINSERRERSNKENRSECENEETESQDPVSQGSQE